MKIITGKGQLDSEKDAIVLVFNNDNELSSFITTIVKTPVRTSGIRILTLIPEGVELSFVQNSVLNILQGLDGVGGNDNEKIINDSIDGLNELIKN